MSKTLVKYGLLWALALSLFVGCSTQHVELPEIPQVAIPRVAEVPFDTTAMQPGGMFAIANLGGAKYKDTMVKAQPQGFGNVQFTNTFGDAYGSIDALLATSKVPFQEYNLKWSDTHSFSTADFPSIVQEAKKYVKLVNKYPRVGCAFSGATEHQLNERDATTLATMVLAVIPDRCVYVNNPWTGRGAFVKPTNRIWNEVHGADAQPPKVGGKFIFNFDGSDAFDYDIEKIKLRLKDAVVFVVWTSQNNGRKNRNDTTPRPQRKAWPTQNLIKAEAFLCTFQGKVRLPSGKYLVKPKSDQHMVPPEDRALKPVFIFPIKVARLELRLNGKKIISSGAPEPFADGRWRYYFAQYGFRIVQLAGSSVLEVWGGNKKIGTVNPGFRQ